MIISLFGAWAKNLMEKKRFGEASIWYLLSNRHLAKSVEFRFTTIVEIRSWAVIS